MALTRPEIIIWATVNIVDSRSIFRMYIGFYTVTVLWPYINPYAGFMSF